MKPALAEMKFLFESYGSRIKEDNLDLLTRKEIMKLNPDLFGLEYPCKNIGGTFEPRTIWLDAGDIFKTIFTAEFYEKHRNEVLESIENIISFDDGDNWYSLDELGDLIHEYESDNKDTKNEAIADEQVDAIQQGDWN